MSRRPRWIAPVAVLAAVVATSGMLTASAGGAPDASSFVPISPCRLIDTRPAPDNVGSRNTAISAGETFLTAVTGHNGNCTIPAGATAVSMNVTAISPTASSFLTIFPGDAARPLSASLTWLAGQAPVGNAVTVKLSADGRVAFFNLTGAVHLAVDVVGYYEAASTAGQPVPAAPVARVITVAKSGGDFTTVSDALASITDNAGFFPYLIKVAPGIYSEPNGIDLKDSVDIEGSGEDVTTLLCSCSSDNFPLIDGSSALIRATGSLLRSQVRELTVANAGGTALYQTAVWISGVDGGVSLEHVTTKAIAPANAYAYGVGVVSSAAKLNDLTASVIGPGTATGVFIFGNTSKVIIRDADVTAAYHSIQLFTGAHGAVYDSTLNGATLGLAGHCYGVVNANLDAYACA